MSPTFRVVLLASALLKLLLALEFARLAPRYDEVDFLAFGERTAAVGRTDLFRAPGYQVFVALGLTLGGGPIGVRLLQVLVSVATSLVVYRSLRRLAGERAALAGGAFVAFYPSHVAFSHLLWAETLFLLPVVGAFDRLLAADSRGSWRTAGLAGVLLGVASLVRSVGVVLLAASCVWLLWPRRRQLAPVAALAGGAALVILPWSIHASSRAGRPMLIDGNAGYNLFSGNNRWIPPGLQGTWSLGLGLGNGVEETRAAQLRRKGASPELAWIAPEAGWRIEVEREMRAAGIADPESFAAADWFRDHALREIVRDPIGALARIPLKLSCWWAPDFFLPRHLLRDWYGPLPRPIGAGVAALAMLASAVPLLLGPAALAALPRSRFRSLALAWLASAALIHALTFAVSRMHQPFVPLLAMAVCLAWLDPGGASPPRRLVRRGLPVLGLALATWILSAPAVFGLYLSPGPRYAALARVLGVLGETSLPAARHATWMRARVVAAAGDEREAERLLARSRHAELPWTLFERALVAEPGEMRPLLERAFDAGPIVGYEAESLRARMPEAR